MLMVVSVCGAAITGCVDREPASGGLDAPRTTAAPVEIVRRVFTPAELDVALDENGRPYDASFARYWADDVEVEQLSALVIPNGALRVMDGNAIEVDPAFFADEASPVDFDTELLDLSIAWEVFEDADRRAVLAVIVSVPRTSVDRWEPFELAYGTDGGVGGFTSQSVIDLAIGLDSADLFLPDVDDEAEVSTYDLDGVPGVDTLVFFNGFGDGAFPMSRGVDADGRLVSVAIVDTRYPWRLAFPVGTPPADITRREDELAHCLAGQRDVEAAGDSFWCSSEV